MRKARGFTINEVLISVFILGLIAAASVVNLRASRQRDELNSAIRVVAADLRSLQARALTGQNTSVCNDGGGVPIVCEQTTSGCAVPASCAPLPPYGVGAYFIRGQAKYDLFAEVAPTKNDWKRTDATEVFQTREFSKAGAPYVVIDDLVTTASLASVNVAFQRQNGTMGIEACYAPCVAPVALTIRLRHTLSNQTRDVSLSAYTGRISVN